MDYLHRLQKRMRIAAPSRIRRNRNGKDMGKEVFSVRWGGKYYDIRCLSATALSTTSVPLPSKTV